MNEPLLSEMRPGPRLRVGDWTVEVTTNSLVKGTLSLQIEPRLMKLLAYLAAHPEQVISKQAIVSQVWQEHFVADEAISVAIYELRKALGDNARNPKYIKTIRKAGFQLIAPVAAATEQPMVEPDPAARETPPSPPPARAPQHRRTALILAAVAAAALAVWIIIPRDRQLPSLAVLPFEYMAEDSRQAYFAAGMTETLITDLASHTDHRVLPRSTVSRFQETDLRTIGKSLGVALCIAGAIQVIEDRVTVTVQVVDTATERHLWARRYEKEIRDFSAIQKEISRDLTQYFGGVQPITDRSSDNLRADVYYSYLMGRRFLNEDTPAGAQKAINQFSLVTRNAPEYAPAHAGLAHCYAFYGHNLALAPDRRVQLAREAAQRALELDERIAEAHLALAVLFFHERNIDAAGRSFEAALRLHPTSVTALRWQVLYLAAQQRFTEARDRLKEARFLDPSSGSLAETSAFVLYLESKYEASAAEFEAAAARKSPDANTRAWHFLAEQARDEAGTLKRDLSQLPPEKAFLSRAIDPAAQSPLSPVVRAALAGALNEPALAYSFLEQALATGDVNLVYAGALPSLTPLRAQPRFQRLLTAAPVAREK